MMHHEAALKYSRMRSVLVSEIKSVNIWLKTGTVPPIYE